MRAAVCPEQGTVAVTDVPDPELRAPTDVILRIRATTICGSDLHLRNGHIPTPWGFCLGHEYVGEVVEIGGAVSQVRIGDRVVGPAAPWCGSCPTCRRGRIQRCPRGGVFGSGAAWGDLGGAQAEYLRVPWGDRILSAVPDTIEDEQALTVGDVLSTGWTAVRRSVHGPGATVLVLGCGPVGLSAIHTASLYGPSRIVAVDSVPERLRLARALGATHTVGADEDVAAAIADLTDGLGAESVIEAAGANAAFATATAAVSIGGTIAVVGIHGAPVEVPMADLLTKNVSIWAGLGDLGRMDELLALIAAGRLDPAPMFTHHLPFDRIEDAYRMMDAGANGMVKPLITSITPGRRGAGIRLRS